MGGIDASYFERLFAMIVDWGKAGGAVEIGEIAVVVAGEAVSDPSCTMPDPS